MKTITTFLMFEGKAGEAIDYYVALFDGAEVLELQRTETGTVQRSRVRLGDLELMLFDSPVPHGFTFTPAISLFVECESVDELDRLYESLPDGGSALMPV